MLPAVFGTVIPLIKTRWIIKSGASLKGRPLCQRLDKGYRRGRHAKHE